MELIPQNKLEKQTPIADVIFAPHARLAEEKLIKFQLIFQMFPMFAF